MQDCSLKWKCVWTELSGMQGQAGPTNNFSVVVVDELGQPIAGQADALSASLSLFPSPARSSSSLLQSLVNGEDGKVVVIWNGTAATPANNSVLYQLNITLRSSAQVGLGFNEANPVSRKSAPYYFSIRPITSQFVGSVSLKRT